MILMVLGSIVLWPVDPDRSGGGGCFRRGRPRLGVSLHRTPEGRCGGQESGSVVWTTLKELGVIVRESSFLTAKTSAMVCWLFIGSGIFSAAFALLGGQDVVENWVLSLG
jgi:hypothetical protein